MADYSTLSTLLADDIECFVFDSLPSTNDYLANLPFCKNPQICITSEQTAGKGQYGRGWLSAKNSSILFSIRINFSTKTPLTALSLAVGLGVLEVLNQHQAKDLKLKWPNDIYFKDKKLAGILLENSVQNNQQSVVIGLGLNSNISADFAEKMQATDLKKILGFALTEKDLLILSADLINKIIGFCDIFGENGFESFHPKWQKYDYLLGKKVTFNDGKNWASGKCAGINSQGLLLIKSASGTKTISSSTALSLA
ncbi:MAG: biotin--[acetyl-CoA-carboxylase] ligase [Candidatus Thioglobus sp.]|nr:biotin--[acetyl-CoA-carboxylase] ligase [Candidatus Thioglobus sp.]